MPMPRLMLLGSRTLRREAALAAIDKALAELPARLDASAQAKLIDSTIKNLENA